MFGRKGVHVKLHAVNPTSVRRKIGRFQTEPGDSFEVHRAALVVEEGAGGADGVCHGVRKARGCNGKGREERAIKKRHVVVFLGIKKLLEERLLNFSLRLRLQRLSFPIASVDSSVSFLGIDLARPRATGDTAVAHGRHAVASAFSGASARLVECELRVRQGKVAVVLPLHACESVEAGGTLDPGVLGGDEILVKECAIGPDARVKEHEVLVVLLAVGEGSTEHLDFLVGGLVEPLDASGVALIGIRVVGLGPCDKVAVVHSLLARTALAEGGGAVRIAGALLVVQVINSGFDVMTGQLDLFMGLLKATWGIDTGEKD